MLRPMTLAGATQPDGIAALKRATSAPPGPHELGDAYDAMIGEVRGLLDAIAGAAPDFAATERLRDEVAQLASGLSGCQVDERHRLWGHWHDRPGRGQAMVPKVYDEVVGPQETSGKVVFGRFHVGENMAAHGGAVATLFDDVLSWLLIRLDLPPSRTAYLHTNFRSVTPIGVELAVRAWIDRVEGRKRFVRGDLTHGDTVCADVEGLWVELRPGQR
ncbi:PaaI family thioesterase [Nocardioides sp.]|jgi:acyl-coenzyme A thioesterase PaaI-like protein|uniref:PaaI family thioesterase n=1 Tax=Nocardioides sp. TaxID=35761 RepID=UPI00321BC3A1